MKLKVKKSIKAGNNTVEVKKTYDNLREIMDWSHQFQMIYSGVENESYFDLLYSMGIRDFLMSYHYITKKGINLNTRLKNREDVRLFIDSGAHTYQNDIEYENVTEKEWEEHLKKYLGWVRKNKEHIFAIASFDFENLVTPQIVGEWNQKYFEPFMLETGIPVCFVWHQNSFHKWEYYCQRYPYVGFSSVNTEGVPINLEEYAEKIRVAEKFDSLVHGFGMTRTAMLTELPFYTSDSTTWLVGLQYGEINYWTGSKMTRLKKDKWKGEYLDVLCNTYGLNKTKLLEEETSELIRANIFAFISAQEYVNSRLKSRMYWLKARTNKQDLSNLPADFFPSPDWFAEADSNRPGYKEYATKMNINPEYEEAETLVCDATVFLNWKNSKYRNLKEFYIKEENKSVIDTLHETYVNRIVPAQEDKINDLIAFFKACVSGENDKLLHLGTNFDRLVKERDSYIEEDYTELVDISEDEVRAKIKLFLPKPEDMSEEGAPEVEALNEEVYRKADIIPVFDERGKFIKGQVAVRKPKKMYSDKYPKFACDTCRAAAKCPEFKQGYVCSFNKMFSRYDTRDMVDIIQAMQGMVGHNLARMQKSMLIETITGENSPEVTAYINQNMSLLEGLRRMYETGSEEVLSQTKIFRADGSREETTKLTNPKEGGILAKIFGNMGKEEPKEDVDILQKQSVYVEDEEFGKVE